MENLPPLLDSRQVAQLLDAMPTGVVINDTDGLVRWMNRSLAEKLNVSAAEVNGKPTSDLPLAFDHQLDDNTEVHRVTNQPDGKMLACRNYPLEGGLTACVVQSELRPKTGLDSVISLLHGRVSSDPGTGALDHTSLMRVLQAEVSRSRRYMNPLSIVYLNVRPTRPVADQEEIMADAASYLREETRWADNIGRYARDVFVLVLPETPADAAQRFVDKLRSLHPNDALYIWQTGLAEWRKGDDATFMIERARESLTDRPPSD